MSEPTAPTDVSEPTETDKKVRRITRRQFLIVAGASGAAALVGLRVLGLPYARLQIADYLDSSGGPPIGVKAAPTAWFEILPDNRVRLFLPKVEMGQGVHTALAQAAADELEAAWENLEVLSAATGQGLDDPVGTSASNSVSSLYMILRQAGATVRQMLRAEGARQLGRPVEETAAEQGYVFVKTDPAVRRSYGEIMAAAPALTVPEQPAPLKADAEFRYIGQPMPRVDLRAKVLGQATYGIDVRLPGMAYGAVAHPPTVEGKLERAAAGRAESMPGVVKVVIDQKTGFAGVVAESREQAYAALDALDLTWDAGHLWQQAEVEQAVTAGGAGGVVIQREGTVRGRLRGSAAVEAEYRVPMAYHAHFEPLTAVADVEAGAARIYTSTQAAVSVRGDVAEALGLKPESVVVSQPYLGAGLGHKVETKAAVEAARLAQAAGRPVHLVWSRAEDFRNSFVRPPTHHILRASLTADGRIETLVHEQASGKVALPFLPAIAGAVLGHDFGAWRGARIGYNIPNRETIAWVADLPFLTGWWRGLGLLPNTFAVECFMDEVAVAAGVDPIELRLRHLPEGSIGERLRRRAAGRGRPGRLELACARRPGPGRRLLRGLRHGGRRRGRGLGGGRPDSRPQGHRRRRSGRHRQPGRRRGAGGGQRDHGPQLGAAGGDHRGRRRAEPGQLRRVSHPEHGGRAGDRGGAAAGRRPAPRHRRAAHRAGGAGRSQRGLCPHGQAAAPAAAAA